MWRLCQDRVGREELFEDKCEVRVGEQEGGARHFFTLHQIDLNVSNDPLDDLEQDSPINVALKSLLELSE